MKRTILLTLMVLAALSGWAQPQEPHGERHFDPAKFQQMVEESLTKAASLTPEEAKVFFPLYNEMRQKQREMGKKMHELKNKPMTDGQKCSETILKIKQLQVDMAELEQSYYKRMLKTVPPEKVFKVMKAEDDFHRRMVQGQRGKHREGKRPRSEN